MRAHRNPHIGGIQEPLFPPPSDWSPPVALPDLRAYSHIAVDLETKDDGLTHKRGPAWPMRGGHVCGVAVAWGTPGQPGGSCYVPVRHPDTNCFDGGAVRRWLDDHAKTCAFVFQNAHYDVGWLRAEFSMRPGDWKGIEDTNCQAVILDETHLTYDLDSLCRRLDIPGKDDCALREALAVYGYPSRGDDWKSNLWHLPARYVGPYAEADATATLAAFYRQCALLQETDRATQAAAGDRWARLDPWAQRGVVDAYRTEMDLVPCVHEMRWRGVRVDCERAARGAEDLRKRRDDTLAELGRRLGRRVGMEDVGRTRWLEEVFTAEGVRFPRTPPTRNFPTGQPSFTAGATGWMPKNPHWLPQLVVEADRLHKASKDFLGGFILGYAHRGRVHGSINQYKSEDGAGTTTHRFSYSHPPLQQMPSRESTIAEVVRGCFLPEDGERWCRADISQQEYRLIVHFAEVLDLPRASVAGDRYRSDPATDYHDMVTEITNPRVDFTRLPYSDHKSAEFKRIRKPAKDANFGKAFGAGVPKFAEMVNLSVEEAKKIYDNYDAELPFVAALAQAVEGAAGRRGYIRLIDGARIHYESWEPRWRDWGAEGAYAALHAGGTAPCPHDEALRREADKKHPWSGALRRAFTRKAGNALIQGSAARWTKHAMLGCWKEGLVPLLQLHDELNISTGEESRGHRMAEIMATAVRLTVPALVEADFGTNWGDAKHKWSGVT